MTKFSNRHIGISSAERDEMLEVVGADSLDALVDQIVPDGIRRSAVMDLPAALSEYEYLTELKAIAE